MTENQTPFSKAAVLEKQKKQREDYEKKVSDLRKAFEEVASTGSGEKLFRYLFVLGGGDQRLICRDKEGKIDMKETLLKIGAKEMYDTIRFNLKSETILKIERHDWEK